MMRLRFGALSRYRPRIATLIVLLAVAAPLVVANLSYHEVTPREWPPANPSYGWPLTWYWCVFHMPSSGARSLPGPDLVRWSGPRLAANLAIWFILLAVPGLVCQWLLRHYAPPLGYRPRIVTLIVLMVVAAPIVLANLSRDDVGWMEPVSNYGWPLIWRWRNFLVQNYSEPRLAGNLAIWLAVLAAPGAACEWMLCRYRPRFRWGLRTMLAVVGLAAVLCAWCAALRDRANVQDPVISVANESNGVYEVFLERWGPKWFDLIGPPDRFRRRVVGAEIPFYEDNDDEQFLKSLARLSTLRYFDLGLARPTPGMTDALARMSQLRTLRIEHIGDTVIPPECLAAVAKLTQLEELHLFGLIDSGSLTYLTGPTRLKSLSLVLDRDDDGTTLLARLPALPRLEAVDIRSGGSYYTVLGDRDIRRLGVLPRLRSLNLSDGALTDAGLAELASLESLEELAIEGDVVTPAGIRSLLALKHLKALHIQRYGPVTNDTPAALPAQELVEQRYKRQDAMFDWERGLVWALEGLRGSRIARSGSYDKSDRLTTLAIGHGDRVFALESEVDGLGRALEALRQANPGIVIDSDPKCFDQEREQQFEQQFKDKPWQTFGP